MRSRVVFALAWKASGTRKCPCLDQVCASTRAGLIDTLEDRGLNWREMRKLGAYVVKCRLITLDEGVYD